jgi:pimeloyl-ACP methyl ester carboxylesterase
VSVDEHTIELAGSPVFYRRAPVSRGDAEVLYLHGLPTSSDDWLPFLERTGGVAPDLVGFGRSSKAGNLELTIAGQVRFLEQLLDALEIERLRLVVHDWGARTGLLLAAHDPQRIESLVVIDAVPLSERVPWRPRFARVWQRPLLGELVMGATTKRQLARELRRGSAKPDVWTDERVATVWDQFDQGTQRAILRLHRDTDQASLSAAESALGQLAVRSMIVWGASDPWLPREGAGEYADRLSDARVHVIEGAGHWPWLDDPSVVDLIAEFLENR